MNLPHELGRKLETAGFEWRHTSDIGIAKASDAAILALAKSTGECILTHDLDYGQFLAFSGDVEPSVVIFRVRRANVDLIFERLMQKGIGIMEALEVGAVVTIEESASRIRPLPIARQ